MIKNQLKHLNIYPNRPEKILIKLLSKIVPNEYKYNNNKNFIIDGYIPDFINVNGQKKIIEFFGCYWHKCPKCGFGNRMRFKDVGRLKSYSKYGYKTLIIWEHELKDIKMVKRRINTFNKTQL